MELNNKVLLEIEVIGQQAAAKKADEVAVALQKSKEQLGALNKAYKDGEISQEEYAKSANKVKVEQSNLRKEQNNLNRSAQEVGKSYNALSAEMGRLLAEQKKLDLSTEAGRKKFGEYGQRINTINNDLKALDKQNGINTRSVGDYQTALKNATGQLNIMGVNVGSVVAQFSTFGNAIVGVAKGFGGASQAAKIFKIALASTGIGLIVIAVGALVTAFSRFTDLSESVAVKFAGFKAIIDVVLDRLGAIGRAIVLVFQGEFSQAAEVAREAIAGVGDELKREIALAQELKEAVIDLEKRSKVFDAQRESLRTEIIQLRNIARDRRETDENRLAALEKADKLQRQLSERSLQLAEEELAASLDSLDAKTKKLKLDAEGLKLIEDIKSGNADIIDLQERAKNLTLNDADAKGTLFELVDKIVARERELQAIAQTEIRITNTRNSLLDEIARKKVSELNTEKQAQELRLKQEEDAKKRISYIKRITQLEIQSQKTLLEANQITQAQYQVFVDTAYDKQKDKISEIIDKEHERTKVKEKQIEKEEEYSITVDDALAEIDAERQAESVAFQEWLQIQERKKAIREQEQADRQRLLEDYARKTEEYAGLFYQFSATIRDASQASTNKQIESIESRYARELELAKGNASLTTALEQKKADEIENVERTQFQRDKRIAQLEAAVNGAVAITKTIAQLGGVGAITPIGAAALALIGTTTAAQIALIGSQQFAEGGRVLGLPEISGQRITGGANIATQPNGDNMLATVKTNEVVLNEQQQMALGGARTFAAIGVPGFASGGATSMQNAANSIMLTNQLMGGDMKNEFKMLRESFREAKIVLQVPTTQAAIRQNEIAVTESTL